MIVWASRLVVVVASTPLPVFLFLFISLARIVSLFFFVHDKIKKLINELLFVNNSGPNGEFDISNKGRVGASEVELVQRMIDGVDKLIDMEEAA